jgi:hypothetical protein
MEKIGNVKVNGFVLYANAGTGNAKMGSKGKATPISRVYAAVSKGEARRVRKRLRALGLASLAAQPRATQ